MKLEAQSLRRALLLGTAFMTGIAGFAGAASALTLQEAVGLIISTNPEVGVTIKDRRAIDYELRQARALYYPQIDVRLDAGIDFSENETTDTGNDRTNQGEHDHGRWLYGRRDAQVTLQQRIFDGFETDSEVERQKQRIASAGQRIQDQGQVSALDGTQVYLDVLRHTERVANAEENVKAHEETLRLVQRRAELGQRLESRQAERIDEHERAQTLAPLGSETCSDGAPERLSHDDRRCGAGAFDQVMEPAEDRVGTGNAGARVRRAVARQIGRDHAIRGRQARDHLHPMGRVARRTMQQHDRWTVAGQGRE